MLSDPTCRRPSQTFHVQSPAHKPRPPHAGDALAAYAILRAFSWQLRLSPVPFGELCAALGSHQTTPLLDDVHVCVLRALVRPIIVFTTLNPEIEDHLDLAELNGLTDRQTCGCKGWSWVRPGLVAACGHSPRSPYAVVGMAASLVALSGPDAGCRELYLAFD